MRRREGRSIGLFARINLSIIILMSLVFVIICLLFSRSFLMPSVQKDLLLNTEATHQISEFMSRKYSTIYNQTKLIHNPDQLADHIVDYLSDKSPYEHHTSLRRISNYCYSLLYSDSDIMDAVLLSESGELIFSVSSTHAHMILPGYPYTELPAVRELRDSPRSILACYMEAQPYADNSCPVLVFGIKIREARLDRSNGTIAYLLVAYPLSIFTDVYEELGQDSGGEIYVVNEDDTVVFSTDPAAQGLPFDAALEKDADVTRSLISTSGLKLVNVMPRNYLRAAVRRMLGLLLAILVPSLLLISLIIVTMNRRYQRRIRHLEAAMSNYNTGGHHQPIPVRHNDELGRLAGELNIMCQRLDTQVRLQYEAELGRKQAELDALQAQINPHFLFNTIESIRMRSIQNGDEEIAEMLARLGQLFHWLIRLDKQIVYLEDEIDYNEAYLDLQRLRYEDSFESEYTIDESLLYMGIPKFTLQPVIENALIHGLHENDMHGKIEIRVRRDGGELVLVVRDNGRGMDREMLERLRDHIGGERVSADMGIGLRNVHSRIRLLFGEPYGLKIDSEPGVGTEVSIRMPALGKKEMQQLVRGTKEDGNV